jgi:hypothetical protein
VVGNTFTWFGGSGNGNVGANWTPAGGPPQNGATAIENAGTIQFSNTRFTSNTFFINAGALQLFNSATAVAASSFSANTKGWLEPREDTPPGGAVSGSRRADVGGVCLRAPGCVGDGTGDGAGADSLLGSHREACGVNIPQRGFRSSVHIIPLH